MKLSTAVFVASLAAGASAYHTALAASPPLLTSAQYEDDEVAQSLRHDPAIEAARQHLLATWGALPQAQSSEGQALLVSAVDESVYLALRTAAADPSRPQVFWFETPPYSFGKLQVPGTRNGDSPDRIYRFAALDPQHSYIIHGRRNALPSLGEFSFEPSGPGVLDLTLLHLSSKDIDIAADGSFTVTADATPANGRRNHLYLPPTTAGLVIRDTLVDWGSQLPNQLTIERVGGPDTAPLSHDELVQKTAKAVIAIGDANVPFLKTGGAGPVNQIIPTVRKLADGMPGNLAGFSRFSVKEGEALVVTLDPLGSEYLGFVVGDPWLRSVNYWSQTGSLNNHQAKPNADGTITYVISPTDPGVYNWLDTDGLHDGVLVLRWEQRRSDADIHQAVRSVRVVPIADLPTALPDAPRITPDERKQLLAKRQAEFALRIAAQ